MPGTKDAAYWRAYRAKRKAGGSPVRSGSEKRSKFEKGEFIAWDGEGISSGAMIDPQTPAHDFTLFANSLGDSLTPRHGESRLSTIPCFELLLSTARRHPDAIHVIYAGGYDMNHILRDLPREHATELAKHGDCFWEGYSIEFFPRKHLKIVKGKQSVILWDVFGFFQMSFVRAVEQWLGADYPDLPLIREGKSLRGEFTPDDTAFLQRYNDAELRALVLLMEQFRDAVGSLDLTLSRWNGAGAVAAAIYSRESFKAHLGHQPAPAEEAARHAYFGGRFELGQYGVHAGGCYGFDINSAYPSVFRDMPSLSHGVWRQVFRPDPATLPDFALVRLRWSIPGIRFGPFPYRDVAGLVLYPTTGANWVWGCELRAFLAMVPDRPDWDIDIAEAWIFTPTTIAKPFQWVQRYYDERQRIVQGISDLPYGSQMVIKLGLNSLYGKTAQSIGYNFETKRKPPYHNIFYAGYITAMTRATLWRAAMTAPESIVMLATDGILSLTPLPVDISTTKELGKWEQTEYDFLLAIQSGVYITGKGGKYTFRKRGIEISSDAKDAQQGIRDFITRAKKHWGNRVDIYNGLSVPQSRLIGIKSAVTSDAFWQRWGCWYHHDHILMMQPGGNTKRITDRQSPNRKPGKGLVWTEPADNYGYEHQGLFSTPYERPWDVESEDEYRDGWQWDDLNIIGEMQDAIV